MEEETLYNHIKKYRENHKDNKFCSETLKNFNFIETYNKNGFMVFDKTHKYRYYAFFKLNNPNKTLTFILFNPSMSDKDYLDPTTRNCLQIASNNHYSSIEIINLYPFRSSKLISEIYNEKKNTEANEINCNLLSAILHPNEQEKNNKTLERDFVLAWGNSQDKEKKAEKMIKFVYEQLNGKTVKKISIKKDILVNFNENKKYIHPSSSLNIFGGADSTELTDVLIT